VNESDSKAALEGTPYRNKATAMILNAKPSTNELYKPRETICAEHGWRTHKSPSAWVWSVANFFSNHAIRMWEQPIMPLTLRSGPGEKAPSQPS